MRRIILNFHGIGEPKRPLETGEAAYWVTEGFFEDCVRLAEQKSDQVETQFTFDDGNLSDLEIGASVLARAGRTATFFVLAGRIGTKGSLSAQDIRHLADAGHQIGNHGADHVDWVKLDADGRTREWDEARQIVGDAAGMPVKDVAIPFGRYRGNVIRGLRQRGYTRIFSSDGGSWVDGMLPIPRTSPRADMTLADIEHILMGRGSIAKKLRRRMAMTVKRWV
ncbi:MAG: polysaccharide deacetylase family protein [Arenibacterium sp.]